MEIRELARKSVKYNRIYHERYLRAINNSLRRKILRSLKDGYITIEELQSHTRLNYNILKWHLNILEWGFCITKKEKEGQVEYMLTKEGEIVNYLK